MKDYHSGYSKAYAVVIATGDGNINRDVVTLGDLLKGFPYQFQVIDLINETATRQKILDIIEYLRDVEDDAKILLYIVGESVIDSNGTVYFICTDTDTDNLRESAVPFADIIMLSRITRAKHMGVIIDIPLSLDSFEEHLELHAPGWGDPTLRRTHQLIVRRMLEEDSPLILPIILNKLAEYKLTESIDLYSTWYSEVAHLSYFFYLKSSDLTDNQAGNLVLYDPPLRHLPEELREALTHPQPLVRQLAVTEAESFVKSAYYQEYVHQTLEELSIGDTDSDVKLRAQEAINKFYHKDISVDLERYSKTVRDVLGGPFVWAYIPVGRTTLLDHTYIQTNEKEIYVQQREYVPESSSNYLPRGGKTYPVQHFLIAVYTITFDQFLRFVEDDYRNPRWWQYNSKAWDWFQTYGDSVGNISGRDIYPITDVNWYEAVAFCLWLQEKINLPIMLPNECQWQRAAQGDDYHIYAWGNSYPSEDIVHWRASGSSPVNSHPEQAKRNAYGLYHMSGNVMEWCTTEPLSGGSDTKLPSQTSLRVVRGGAWNSKSEVELQAAFRTQRDEALRSPQIGFRITCSL